jgi:hypothetical protein
MPLLIVALNQPTPVLLSAPQHLPRSYQEALKEDQLAEKEKFVLSTTKLQKLLLRRNPQKLGLHQANGAVDAMSPGLGISGTGKTMLQVGLALPSFRMGLHLLLATPTNNNADNMTGRLAKNTNVVFKRLYADSLNLTGPQSRHLRGVSAPPIFEDSGIENASLLRELQHYQTQGVTAREYGFQAAVVRDARERKHRGKVVDCYRDGDRKQLFEDDAQYDVWEEMMH